MNGPYDDIINLPHHVSATRPQMPIAKRAAQFSPFAALTGYDAAIMETARLTDQRVELGESDIAVLNMKLNLLADRIDERPEITLTYFLLDEKKEGGAYVTATGPVKKIDEVEGTIVFTDDKSVAIDDVLEIACELFGDMNQ